MDRLATDPDLRAPRTLGELVKHCEAGARGRWEFYQAIDLKSGLTVYYARPTFHAQGSRYNAARTFCVQDTARCVRCGGGSRKGHNWHDFPPPTLFERTAILTICLPCLDWWIKIWPDVFPRLKLAPRTQKQVHRYGGKRIENLAWWSRPPFRPDRAVVR